MRDLKEKTDEIYPIYINCWKKDTSYKILLDICEQLDYKWTHNKRTDELIKVVSEIVNKKAVVIVLDEVDRVKELDILYTFSEDFLKKTIIMIANDPEWIVHLDERIKSRLNVEVLKFNRYKYSEIFDILKYRVDYAFSPDVVDNLVLELVSEKSFECEDVRKGIFLLRESGDIAESKGSRKILIEHCKRVIEKSEEFKIKKKEEFGLEEQKILDLVKENSGVTIKDLFELYSGDISYRTFHRKIEELSKNNMISLGEKGGRSISVFYTKKLNEF